MRLLPHHGSEKTRCALSEIVSCCERAWVPAGQGAGANAGGVNVLIEGRAFNALEQILRRKNELSEVAADRYRLVTKIMATSAATH
jgi:hypothetical protein